MATKRDYYDVLGVSRSATKDDLKKAYRRLARQYHPDVNSEDSAGDRFKEVNEAYEVLSDERMRATYDQFGHAGVQNGGGSGFSGFGGFEGGGFGSVADIFEEFFGGSFSGGRSRRRRGPMRGQDIRSELIISFEEAVFGAEKEIEVIRPEICPSCNGSGAKTGTSPIPCTSCNGSGEVRRVQQSILGQFVNVATCPTCQGTGELIPEVCVTCNGRKQVQQTRTIKVKVPQGVDNDTQIRLSGEGSPGANGGPPGNLFVVLYVQKHEFFERRGDDVWLDLQINVAQAALGDEVKVPTLDGEETLVIEPGTESGKVYRLRGHGVPRLDRRGRGAPLGRGDQHVLIHVVIPQKLTADQEKLFHELSRTLGKEVIPQRGRGIFSQFKDVLGEMFGG
jgi:molecular chaperone DnaJ